MTTPPMHYSDRDLQSLRLQLERGDVGQRAEAVRELAKLGGLQADLVSLVVEQLRRGLRIPSAVALDLLEVCPDPGLYESLVASGSLATPSIHERCRLFVLRLGEFEGDLCTYVYRHWREWNNVWVRFALAALADAGTETARSTLGVSLPELAEHANTLGASLRLTPKGRRIPREECADLLAWEGATARLEQVRTALTRIDARLVAGEGDSA